MSIDLSKTNGNSEKVKIEELKTEQKAIDAQGKVAKQQLAVAKEALKVIQSFSDVWKEHKKLQQTEVEWDGRVKEIKEKVNISENNLEEQLSKEKENIKKIDLLDEQTVALRNTLNGLSEKVNKLPLGDERKKWTKIINDTAGQLAEVLKQAG